MKSLYDLVVKQFNSIERTRQIFGYSYELIVKVSRVSIPFRISRCITRRKRFFCSRCTLRINVDSDLRFKLSGVEPETSSFALIRLFIYFLKFIIKGVTVISRSNEFQRIEIKVRNIEIRYVKNINRKNSLYRNLKENSKFKSTIRYVFFLFATPDCFSDFLLDRN